MFSIAQAPTLPTRLRRLALLAAALACPAAALAPPAAHASSIVYLKAGNVWLISPDGTTGYQVTTGSGWQSPSQADDGTIVAQQGTSFVHLDRSGRVLGRLDGVGGSTAFNPAGTVAFYGPFDPKVSPDGTQIAYWFTYYEDTIDPSTGVSSPRYVDETTTTPIDHLAFGPGSLDGDRRSPSWAGNGHLLVDDPFARPNVSSWVPGHDASYDEGWFSAPAGYTTHEATLSRDGAIVASTAASNYAGSPASTIIFSTTNGSPWSADGPPFAIGETGPEPTGRCSEQRDSEIKGLSFAPDASALAFSDARGVWITHLPDISSSCAGATTTLLATGGSSPGWGPADVNPAQAPGSGPPATGGPIPTPPPAATGPAGQPTPGPGSQSKHRARPHRSHHRPRSCRVSAHRRHAKCRARQRVA